MTKRLILISCGKKKIWDEQPGYGYCPARNSYSGAFFTCNRRYAEKLAPDDWMVFSARFGLVRPDTPISDYNATFKHKSPELIDNHQIRVGAIQLGIEAYDEIEVLAGREYVDRLYTALRGFSISLVLPFAGCSGNGDMMGRAKSATIAGISMDTLDDGFETRTISLADVADVSRDRATPRTSPEQTKHRGRSSKTSNLSFIRRAFDLSEHKQNSQRDAMEQAAKEFEIELPRSYLQHPGSHFHRWRSQGYGPSDAQPNQPGVQPTSPSGHQVDTEKPELVDCSAIVERLIEVGTTIGAKQLAFENDQLDGKLAKEEPFAFLLAASINRGMKAETVWRLPARLKKVLGHLEPSRIAEMSVEEMLDVFKKMEGRPRFLSASAQTLIEVAKGVVWEYDGDASNLWKNQPAVTINQRMQQFQGVGPGIASMVVILLEKFNVVTLRPEDYTEMDPKPDVHVQRVFSRLGLCERNPTERNVIKAARRLHPSYPGKLDGPSWHIGRTWCHSERPDCSGCPMNGLCPKLI